MGTVRRMPAENATALLGDVPRLSVRETIAGKLGALVSSGVLCVGDELPGERELASALSVSRETVRGAIAILSERGILKVAQGSRTTVARVDPASSTLPGAAAGGEPDLDGPYALRSVHEARILVERRLAAEAARRATPRLVEEFRRSLAAQEACGDDAVRFLLADREFHGLLYRASGNGVLSDMAMQLYNHLLDHRRRIVARPGTIETSIADHRAIAAGVERRDVEATTEAVGRHATRIYETTRAFLESRAG
jgi:DNA-binding FadR family transcriptional regulator